jgi:hypothetical protein
MGSWLSIVRLKITSEQADFNETAESYGRMTNDNIRFRPTSFSSFDATIEHKPLISL